MSNFFYQNSRLMYLTISLILVAGLSSYFILPRMEDPQLVARGAFIHTVFPGAEPERVESLVSEKIEDELSDIKEIKEIRSASRSSISTIAIELRDDVMDGDRVWSKIRDRLGDVESKLPAGVRPRFEEMDFKAFATLLALRWERETPVNYAILQRWGKELEDSVKLVRGTEKVELFGQPTEEVLVTLDADQLAGMNLTIADVSRQITSSDAKVAAGQLRSNDENLLIEVSGELDSVDRIESIPIRFNDRDGFVRLSSIAKVERSIADPPDSLAIIEGKRSIVLGGFVRPENRIDVWSRDLAAKLNRFESELPDGIVLDRLFDQNSYVSTRLSTLVSNLLMGAMAVFVVIFLLMGWRSALVVSIALPLAGMMVLFGMRIMEIPIHQMSVTGLIIALGLLIDNAIVIVEEMSIKLKGGATPGEAVSKSVTHLFLPLLGSTLTTAFAFAPIALMPGPAGEFVGAIAVNVIIAIFSSFFLAMTVIPAVSARLTKFTGGMDDTDTNARSSWFRSGYSNRWLANLYHKSLDLVFARPLLGVAFGMVLPILGFVASGQLKEQFFPPADRDQLHIEMELSASSSIENTLATTREMREVLLQDPRVKRVDWFIGESAPAFYYNLISRRANVSAYAQAMVQLNSFENQSETIHELQTMLDRRFAHARSLVRQLEQGPPFDAPVEVRLFGPDLDRLQELGSELRRILVGTPGVIHTRVEMDEVLQKVAFDADEERTQSVGLNLREVAFQLNAATEGAVGGSILETTEELPVRVRLENQQRADLKNLASIDIVNPTVGMMQGERYRGIPVTALGEFKTAQGVAAINHLAGLRMNELQAFIPAGKLPSTVLSEFEKRLAATDFELPAGYSLTYGGEAAKRDEAVGNLMASVGILIILMIATLVLSFSSFRIAGIIGSVGVLSIGLGLGALWIFGYPFGFMAIVGAMGLMGVAINDTIVVLAAIRDNEAAAQGDRIAMRETVSVATRHIVSTSLTTMAGFAPLILGGGGFWPPLAVAIAGGVGGATILALYLAPSAYLLLMCRGGYQPIVPDSPL